MQNICEGEYQVKDDGYSISKQQSANIPDARNKQQQSIILNDHAYDERQHKKKDGKAIINIEAVELTIGFGDLSLIDFILIIGLLAGYLVDWILVSFISLDLIGFIIVFGLIGLIGISLVGISSLIGLLASFNCWLGQQLKHSCLDGLIGLGLVSHTGLIGYTGFVGLDSFVSLVGLGFISLLGLICFIGLIGLVGLIGIGLIGLSSISGFGGFSLVGRIGFIAFVGILDLVGLIGLIGLGDIGLSNRQLHQHWHWRLH